MKKQARFSKTLETIFILILSSFYGVIASGSILGVTGLYRKPYSIILMICAVLGLSINLFSQRDLFQKFSRPDRTSRNEDYIDWFFYALSLGLIVILVLIPIIRWPMSIAGDWFPWDAGLYHFPKAVEMYRSGSANDLSIAYGEYPFGYETLLAYCLSLGGSIQQFGWVHCLIEVYFLLSFWLLARRMTGLRPSLILFAFVCMSFSKLVFQFLNIWQVFYSDLYTVGKNDLLLTASVIAALAFYPIQVDQVHIQKYWLPFGMTSMIALSIKPNAALVLAPVWLIAAARLGKNLLKDFAKNSEWKREGKEFLVSVLILLPGLLWMLRNFLVQGTLFSEQALVASKWSIAENLTNPYFYQYIPKNMVAIIVFTLCYGIFCLFYRQQHRWYFLCLLILEIAFIFTPVTAFFIKTDVPAKINWRFGEPMLAYLFILMMFFIEKLSDILTQGSWRKLLTNLALIAGFIFSMYLLSEHKVSLKIKPENEYILHDQFDQPVGVDGYYSAYDYIQRNANSSIVWVENGLPFYIYDPHFTNSVSRKKAPDYIVLIKNDWFGETGRRLIPAYFPSNWEGIYEVIYDDPQGVVFQPLR